METKEKQKEKIKLSWELGPFSILEYDDETRTIYIRGGYGGTDIKAKIKGAKDIEITTDNYISIRDLK